MSSSSTGSSGPKRTGRIRPRPVSFGNPALGTYGGCVYTVEQVGNGMIWTTHKKEEFGTLKDNEAATNKLVAMVNVPPEQVPEGILNFCRSHRRYIELVRIVISSGRANNEATAFDGLDASAASSGDNPPPLSLEKPALSSTRNEHNNESLTKQLAELDLDKDVSRFHRKNNVLSSPSASAMENAASILAADEEEAKTKQKILLEHSHDVTDDEEDLDNNSPSRTYIVLFQLSSEQAAQAFVRDLDGKPYNSLEKDVTGSVFHVVALKGQDGVSLMSPFFAPSSANLSSSPSSNTEKQQQHGSNVSGQDGRSRTPTHEETNNKNMRSSPLGSSHGSELHKNALSTPLTTTSTHAGEVQNCAVCLERLDVDQQGSNNGPKTSILTTVCNHSFHLECLLQWQDSPCPVCRYDHSGLNEALSTCHVCGTTEHNYVCLICGIVSCGGRLIGASAAADSATASGDGTEDDTCSQHQQERESSSILPPSASSNLSHGHARQHYNETLHAYALDTETQHVWDFVGQGYVHRLLQNAKDDKLVEVTDPNNTSSYERSLSSGLSDAQEGEVVHRKLEGFASQYYTLLKSQLEQQRIYYEGRLEEIRREYDKSNTTTSGSNRRGGGGRRAKKKKQTSASAELISALKQERNQLAQRSMTLQRRLDKVSEDVGFLKNMTESLEANKGPLKRQVLEAQRERAETHDMIRSCLPPLEDKVAKLMMQLEDSVEVEADRAAQGRKFFGGDKKPAARK